MSGNVVKWVRYLGDADQIEVQLTGLEEILPGAQVSAKVVSTTDGATTAITGASVTDLDNYIVSVPLTTWLADNSTGVGTYHLYIELNDVTWPEFGRAEIQVKPNHTPS